MPYIEWRNVCETELDTRRHLNFSKSAQTFAWHNYKYDSIQFILFVSCRLKADLQMAEAVGLVNTLQNWTVVDKIILSTKTPEKKRIFGKGNFQMLTGLWFFPLVWRKEIMRWIMKTHFWWICAEKIRRTAGISAVFMNVERLSSVSEVRVGDLKDKNLKNRNELVMFVCFLVCVAERAAGGLGGEGVRQILTGSVYFPP